MLDGHQVGQWIFLYGWIKVGFFGSAELYCSGIATELGILSMFNNVLMCAQPHSGSGNKVQNRFVLPIKKSKIRLKGHPVSGKHFSDNVHAIGCLIPLPV